MGAAKKLEMYPDEQFLANAIKDGRATRQEISMKALGKPDVRLQAREQHLDMDHVRMLAEILEREGQLAPVVIFRTRDGKLLLADGFHRHEVYRKAGLPSAPAWVIDGDSREAIEYATTCNRRLCLARKPGDIRKAIAILLADDVWFQRSDLWVGDHIGCSPATVANVRRTFCEERSISPPRDLIARNGKPVPQKSVLAPRIHRVLSARGKIEYSVMRGSEYLGSFSSTDEAESARRQAKTQVIKPTMRAAKHVGRKTRYYVKIAETRINLGTDKEAAQAEFDQLWDEHLKTLAQPPADPPAPPTTIAPSPSPGKPRCPHCGYMLTGWSAPE